MNVLWAERKTTRSRSSPHAITRAAIATRGRSLAAIATRRSTAQHGSWPVCCMFSVRSLVTTVLSAFVAGDLFCTVSRDNCTVQGWADMSRDGLRRPYLVQQVAILGRCLRSAWWLRVTVSCLFKKAHGPRPLHRPPSIFGKHPLQKWSFRDTLTHRTKQSVQHVWTPPTVHVRYIRYLSYFPTDRDRLSFRDTRTHRLDRLGCPRPLLKSVT